MIFPCSSKIWPQRLDSWSSYLFFDWNFLAHLNEGLPQMILECFPLYEKIKRKICKNNCFLYLVEVIWRYLLTNLHFFTQRYYKMIDFTKAVFEKTACKIRKRPSKTMSTLYYSFKAIWEINLMVKTYIVLEQTHIHKHSYKYNVPYIDR